MAFIQALRQLANQARANGEGGALACIAECILGCIQGIIEYFNKWAYTYVGLYGYSYLEVRAVLQITHYHGLLEFELTTVGQAGKNVFTLFRNRGWEAIIADDLVGNTLFLVSIVVGGLSGVAGIILERASNILDDVGGNSTLVAFM